jgi:hypothetical protein
LWPIVNRNRDQIVHALSLPMVKNGKMGFSTTLLP